MSRKERTNTTIVDDASGKPGSGMPHDGAGAEQPELGQEHDAATLDQPGPPAEADAEFEDHTNPDVHFDAIAAVAEIEQAQPAGSETTDVTDVSHLPAEEGGYVALLESEVHELSLLLEQRDARLRGVEDEAERSRTRIERDAARRIEEHARGVILGFVEVLDDLDRALAAARHDQTGSAVVADGLELVRRRFMGKLAVYGVEHQPSMGERFDPEVHEAISVVPVTDAANDGMVMGVVREGYRSHGQILRPAGVVVGKMS